MGDHIRQSTVVRAFVVDQYGQNEKHRSSVVIKVEDSVCYALAISSSVDFANLGEYQITVPHAGDGKCKTGLTVPSAVCCDWVVEIPLDECTHSGFIPAKLMPPILDALIRFADKKGLPVQALAKARK